MNLFAADFPPSLWNNVDPNNLTSINDILQILANVILIIIALGGAIAVIFVIRAGLSMVTSSGDPAKVATARSAIIYAAVGLILSAGSYLLVDFIASQFS